MKSDQNNPDNFPSTESIEELDSKETVKLKKQLLRGSSEKIMMTNKFKKNAGDNFFPNDYYKVTLLTHLRSKPRQTELETKVEFEVKILFT